ncbi:MAG: amino acid ABC transporter permease [Chloroflexi bacterium]|nr:amino acid ABC transporter permease [Chloroflexota bacterium]
MTAFAAARRHASGRGTLIAAAIVVAFVALLFLTGRIDGRKWQPFLELSTWRFLGEGLLVTLGVAGAALLLSMGFGLVLGVLRAALPGRAGWSVAIPMELARATPILTILLVVFFGLLRAGGSRDPAIAGIIGLTIYNSAVIGEIVRAGIASIARGESEAARSLGLSYIQTMRAVVLPQALARMTPALVSQLITLIKDTSLLFILAAPEVLSQGRAFVNFYSQQVGSVLLETYFVIACIFFAINYPLSRFSRRLEARRPAHERVHVLGEEDQPIVLAEPTAGRP